MTREHAGRTKKWISHVVIEIRERQKADLRCSSKKWSYGVVLKSGFLAEKNNDNGDDDGDGDGDDNGDDDGDDDDDNLDGDAREW